MRMNSRMETSRTTLRVREKVRTIVDTSTADELGIANNIRKSDEVSKGRTGQGKGC